ncbi:MAG: GspE/PulE family protein [Acetobacterales bacterium]
MVRSSADVASATASAIERLRASGAVDEAGLARARSLAGSTGEPLHRLLPRLGLVGEAAVARALADSLGLRLAGDDDYPSTPVLGDRLSAAFLNTCRVLPLAADETRVAVAMADPLDEGTLQALALQLGRRIEPHVAVPVELDRHLARLYGDAGEGGAVEAGVDSAEVERLREMASEVPVVRLVNRLIERAVAARASDIHLEPDGGALRLRHRVDGVLRDVEALPAARQAAVISRIKIMAGLNIVERRLPQDGRCKVTVQGRAIDLRVSCLPAMHGEGIVLRILDKAAAPLALDRLGLGEALQRGLAGLLDRGDGIVLVTGPTGSGKTTTLYAALERLNRPERKIVTVEDPVEYQLSGISQIQVRPDIGLGFATVLRSTLRHDPDVIMVGEIRDLETAQIAVQAALTGHLVLSTLHTTDAPSAVTRLADMGVEPYLITSAVRGVVAQRLLRTLCPHCRTPVPDGAARLAALGHEAADATVFAATGCDACGGSGYAGRQCVAEMLPLDEGMRELVLRRADAPALRAAARAAGMAAMRADGLDKAARGLTAIEEVLRVTQEA